MKTSILVRSAAVALVMAAAASTAFADGDKYFRLFEMQAMDSNHDGAVSKTEFLAKMGKAWDMQASDMKVRGKMNADQIKELEKVLGRTLSSMSGS